MEGALQMVEPDCDSSELWERGSLPFDPNLGLLSRISYSNPSLHLSWGSSDVNLRPPQSVRPSVRNEWFKVVQDHEGLCDSIPRIPSFLPPSLPFAFCPFDICLPARARQAFRGARFKSLVADDHKLNQCADGRLK